MSANGYLTDTELAPIDNGQRLRPDAAPRYLAMLAAAARDGVTIITTEGYRDYATQVELWELYGSPRASRPGYSPHGLGLAVDVNTDGFGGAVFDWLTAHAAEYGFNNRVGFTIDEHWHWVYDGTGTAGLAGTPTALQQESENDMAKQVFKCDNLPTGGVYLIVGVPAGPGDYAIRVTAAPDPVNVLLWGRDKSAADVRQTPAGILAGILAYEVGYFGPLSALTHGFTWGPYMAPPSVEQIDAAIEDEILVTAVAAIRAQE